MTKAYSRSITAMFALFLGGMLVWSLLLPDRHRSDVENRTLAQWPEFSWQALKDGTFTDGVEAYFADQFPLRDQWTVVKARAEQLLGKTEFNGVYLCDKETLIQKVERPEAGLPEKNLGYVSALAGKTESDVILSLIPSAALIWQDKLPEGAYSYDQQLLLDMAGDTGLPMADLQGALGAHRDEQIFYRTDHHWTTLGAFSGANALLEALGKEPLDMADFTPEAVSDSFCGTLYSNSGIHWLTPDTMEFWVDEEGLSVTSWRTGTAQDAPLYDRSWLQEKDKYSAFLGGNQPLCVIRNEKAADGGKLLLVRDRYSDAMAPFLAQRFAEVHLLDLRQYRMPVSLYARQEGIGQIAVVYSVPNFITDKNLVFLGQ